MVNGPTTLSNLLCNGNTTYPLVVVPLEVIFRALPMLEPTQFGRGIVPEINPNVDCGDALFTLDPAPSFNGQYPTNPLESGCSKFTFEPTNGGVEGFIIMGLPYGVDGGNKDFNRKCLSEQRTVRNRPDIQRPCRNFYA